MTRYKSVTFTTFSRLNWQDSGFRSVILAPMLDFLFLMGFFASRRCYSEHSASASRVRAPAKGCRTTAIICPIRNGRVGDAECFVKGGRVGVPSPGPGG